MENAKYSPRDIVRVVHNTFNHGFSLGTIIRLKDVFYKSYGEPTIWLVEEVNCKSQEDKYIFEEDFKSLPLSKFDMNEQLLRQHFRNRFDCYADTWKQQKDGTYVEGPVIMAMTEDQFIAVLRELNMEKEIEKLDKEQRGISYP